MGLVGMGDQCDYLDGMTKRPKPPDDFMPEFDETTRVGLSREEESRWRRDQSREQGWVLAVLLAWTAGLICGWLFFP